MSGASRSLTKHQWTSTLRLADMWGFDTVLTRATHELHRLIPSHAERIRLARRFAIPGWVEPALCELARQDALPPAELELLGWDAVAKLLQVRESVQFGGCMCPCNYCSISHGPLGGTNALTGSRPAVLTASCLRRSMDFGPRIREVFGDELL